MGFYNKENCDFMKSMNAINIFTAGYIYYKRGLFFAIPHASVCVTSWFFWRNVENDFYKILDYSAVANTIFFTYYESVSFSCSASSTSASPGSCSKGSDSPSSNGFNPCSTSHPSDIPSPSVSSSRGLVPY